MMKKFLLFLLLALSLNADIMQEIERFNELLKDAKSGKVLSQFWVAERYFDGKGTQVDNAKAIYWFRESAKQGYMKSMFILGRLLTQNATSDEIMQLGIKYFDDLANYDKKFPHLHDINSNYETKYRKRAYKELILLYAKGAKYLLPDEKKSKIYFEQLKQFSKDSKFAELLEGAGLFYANEQEDKKNQADFIELIKNGSDVNATYKESKGVTYSLLFYSIEKNNKELFELLLSKGVDVNFTNEKGNNAFYRAIWNGNLAFAKKLYEKGIKLDFTTTKRNPLIITSLNEKKEILEYLIKIGYNPHKNIIDQKNMLEFLLADSYRVAQILNYKKRKINIEFIEWVIKKYEFDVNALYHGKRALHLVSMKIDMKEKVELLLKLGAEKTLKDKAGDTPKEFYEKLITKNKIFIKKYENSKANKVRVVESKNRNIQGIIDNAFGKQYYYKDAVYEGYNKNLEEAIELLSKYKGD
jgi:ankyrin repeat protein